MAVEIEQFTCRSDNFGVLVRDRATGVTALVDAPEEGPILAAIGRTGWRPTSRFSSTVMSGKTCRPSGTCAMPSAAIDMLRAARSESNIHSKPGPSRKIIPAQNIPIARAGRQAEPKIVPSKPRSSE